MIGSLTPSSVYFELPVFARNSDPEVTLAADSRPALADPAQSAIRCFPRLARGVPLTLLILLIVIIG